MAKFSSLKVHWLVSQSDELDREDAKRSGVNLITAKPRPYLEPFDWLQFPPPEIPNLQVVIGHGRRYGSSAYFIQHYTNCKWVQLVDDTRDAVEENELKHKSEIELCKAANQVVAVGPILQAKYQKSLPNVMVESITPGILEELSITQQLPDKGRSVETEVFNVFVSCRGSYEDFELKGYDIIANAIGSLGDNFELKFVGPPSGQHKAIKNWFQSKSKITSNQLTVRGYCTQNEHFKRMLEEADLVALPSRKEGFGVSALLAISAGIPVLVSSESGIAKALEEVEGGNSVIITYGNTEEWAKKIQQLSRQTREERLIHAMCLREKYRKVYPWRSECKRFETWIRDLVKGSHPWNSINDRGKGTFGHTRLNERKMKSDDEEKREIQTSTKIGECELLHLTTKDGNIAAIEELLSQGWYIDARDSDEKTPLMIAAYNGKAEVVNFLLENGADAFLRSEDGSTLLHFASWGGNVTIIEMVEKQGVHIDSTNSDDNTPLMYAAFDGQIQVVNCLLKLGADPFLKGRFGRNSLHWASSNGNMAVIEALLSRGVVVDSRDWSGKTPLMYAASLGKEEAVAYLLHKGANPSLESNLGKNLLHFSSQGGSITIIKAMLSRGLDINSRDVEGNTPLSIAAAYRNDKASKYLLDKGGQASNETPE